MVLRSGRVGATVLTVETQEPMSQVRSRGTGESSHSWRTETMPGTPSS